MKRYIKQYLENKKGFNTIVKRLQTQKLKKGKEPMTAKKAKILWAKAEDIAKKQGQEKNYAYIMAIFKRATGYKPIRKRK